MALMEEELRDVSLPHRRSAPPLNIPYAKVKPCCGGSANNTVVEVIRASAGERKPGLNMLSAMSSPYST
ncbi:hypothetical protein GQ607_016104 [Colletotrichum asianum]|uniref:Uncharacterized protein n=1 Tax=Colletotrichum asianum TaxID=702518 RepID=A0A8H3ZI13_9PEZI|nr:hypothetical protein GQ607_016104 [Colletotrichum asianum]